MANIKKSAGILTYRFVENNLQVLLVHPGGPYFAKKDAGAWSIPKGEFENEEPLEAAKREFAEEIGLPLSGQFIELTPIVQKGGKTIYAWAIENDIDVKNFRCNMFRLEWPVRSGKFQEFPEVDKAEWFELPVAMQKINERQALLIHELLTKLNLTIPR